MSARIEDVLAEHETIVHCDEATDEGICICDGRWPWDNGDLFGGHRKHIAEELAKAGFGDVAQARKDALTELQLELKCAAEGFRSSVTKDEDPRERARMNGRYGGVMLALSFVERDLREEDDS